MNSVRFRCHRTKFDDSTVSILHCLLCSVHFLLLYLSLAQFTQRLQWTSSMSNHKNKQQTNICFVRLNPKRFYGQFPWHPSARLPYIIPFGRSYFFFLSLFVQSELDFKCAPQPDRFDYIQIYGHENYTCIPIAIEWRGRAMRLHFRIIIYLFII